MGKQLKQDNRPAVKEKDKKIKPGSVVIIGASTEDLYKIA